MKTKIIFICILSHGIKIESAVSVKKIHYNVAVIKRKITTLSHLRFEPYLNVTKINENITP